jgi:hypothetical protein
LRGAGQRNWSWRIGTVEWGGGGQEPGGLLGTVHSEKAITAGGERKNNKEPSRRSTGKDGASPDMSFTLK